MSKQPSTLSEIGEFKFISQLIQRSPLTKVRAHREIRVGVGDDACVLKLGKQGYWVITKDLLFEGSHFKLGAPYHFRLLGRKAAKVNLSDIAAMGVWPKYVLIGVGISPTTKIHDWKDFLSGFEEACRPFGVKLIGGDANKFDRWVLSITMLGYSPGKPMLRSTAKVGDELWVTGTLGASALGLKAISKKKNPSFKKWIRCHLDPPVRIREGQALGRLGYVSSMIDVSDGIGHDLKRISERSNVGFKVFVEQIPVEKNFHKIGVQLGCNPLKLITYGGEDYELLFTVKHEQAHSFRRWLAKQTFQATPIGEVTTSKLGIRFLDPQGKVIKIKGPAHHF